MSSGKSILAIDSARTTGWAYDDGTGLLVSSIIPFGKETVPNLLCSFNDWIFRKVDLYKPDYLAYEQPHMRGTNTYYLITFTGLMQMVTARFKMPPPIIVHSATIKAAALGRGKRAQELNKQAMKEMIDEGVSTSRIKSESSKRAILIAARQRWQNVRDDNEADALFMCAHVGANLDELTKPQPKKRRSKKKK